MDLFFLGPNTAAQAQGFIEATQSVSLDFDNWPIQVDAYFTEDPDPTQPDEFAITNTLEPGHFEIKFRNDAPHFQNGAAVAHFDVSKFYEETVIHELGHVLSFSLNEVAQTLLSRLFQVSGPDEWFPPSALWGDRPGEAIAETFKDAFMPQSAREYSNRTNIRLNYPFFPLFRAIFRHAVTSDLLSGAESLLSLPPGDLGAPPASTVGTGESDPDALDVPAYDLDMLRFGDAHQKDIQPQEPIYWTDATTEYAALSGTSLGFSSSTDPGGTGLDSVGDSWEEGNPDRSYFAGSDSLEPDLTGPSTSGVLVEPGTSLEWEVDFPDLDFFDPSSQSPLIPWNERIEDSSTFADPSHVFNGIYGSPGSFKSAAAFMFGIIAFYRDPDTDRLIVLPYDEMEPPDEIVWQGMGHQMGYQMASYIPNWPTNLVGAEIILFRHGECEGQGPPFAMSRSITVSSLPAEVRACHAPVEPVRILSEIHMATYPADTLASMKARLPSIPINQAAHPACGSDVAVEGETPATGLVIPGGSTVGQRHSPRPVSGSRISV